MSENDDDEHASEWEDLTDRELLEGVFQLVAENRALLQAAVDGGESDASDDTGYRCRHCGALVPASDRERHAVSEHKAPPERVDAMFERA